MKATEFRSQTGQLGLGLGMDLPWGTRIGFERSTKGDDISPSVRNFLQKHIGQFSYAFMAFQPRDWGKLEADRYFDAYDKLYAEIPEHLPRIFHHTMLNTGNPESFDKNPIATFTNDLARRYRYKWIVEDLGIWSFRGKTLPYPLPPLLTDEGREACINHIREWKKLLDVPVSIEFPGFTEGGSFLLGHANAFEFYRQVIEESGALATIDIGHILGYQWFRGKSGKAAYEDLELLPLNDCVEFHLSGCQIVDGKFRDLHHGILLDEQMELLDYLLPLCPNLVGVTYEDPIYDKQGNLVPKSIPNFERLVSTVKEWSKNDV